MNKCQTPKREELLLSLQIAYYHNQAKSLFNVSFEQILIIVFQDYKETLGHHLVIFISMLIVYVITTLQWLGHKIQEN